MSAASQCLDGSVGKVIGESLHCCENNSKLVGTHAQRHYHLEGTDAKEQCAAFCQKQDDCFLFEFDSSYSPQELLEQPNCRLFLNPGLHHDFSFASSADHIACGPPRCEKSYDGSDPDPNQCPYDHPRCETRYGFQKCVSDYDFYETQIDEVDCSVLEDDDIICYRSSKYGAVCSNVRKVGSDEGDIASILRVNATSSKFPDDLCYKFSLKTFSKNFECTQGKAGNGLRVNIDNSGNTYSDCRDSCLQDRTCDGFDFTPTADGECRYYQGDGQTTDDDPTRTHCELKTSDRADHPERPVLLYCMGQSKPDCVYAVQNMFERAGTHQTMIRTRNATEKMVEAAQQSYQYDGAGYEVVSNQNQYVNK